MRPQSGNEILEEAKKYTQQHHGDPYLWHIWAANVRKAVEQHQKTMDDKIFILNEDGKHYDIDPDAVDEDDDAYQRAMSGI